MYPHVIRIPSEITILQGHDTKAMPAAQFVDVHVKLMSIANWVSSTSSKE
jgi:hypothetical protein